MRVNFVTLVIAKRLGGVKGKVKRAEGRRGLVRLEILGKRFLQFVGMNFWELRPMKFFGNSLKDKLTRIEHFDTY